MSTPSPDITASNASSLGTETLTPVAQNERIVLMDLLRGFALVGILLMNIEWFNRPISALISFDMSQTGIDWGASWLIKVLIEGKFYKLFSLLFGMGFAVMLLRAQEKNRPFGAWFTRRMIALYVFGLCHLFFLWGGDILHDYALGGMMLLGIVYLLKTKKLNRFDQPNTYGKIGFYFVLIPYLAMISSGIFFGVTRTNAVMKDDYQQRMAITQQVEQLKQASEISDEIPTNTQNTTEVEKDKVDVDASTLTPEELIQHRAQKKFTMQKERQEMLDEESSVFSQGTYIDVTKYRIKDALDSLMFSPIFAFTVCLPMFLIGYWLVASKRIKYPEQHQSFFDTITYGGLFFGLFLSVIGAFLKLHPANPIEIRAIGNISFQLGQFVLCFGYLGLIVKLAQKSWFTRWFSWLSPLGKMALTNYIMHSVILTSVFYGYAGGMFGQIDRGFQVLMVISIIALQSFACHYWLKQYKFGPLEWLWRCITYRKLQTLKISTQQTADTASQRS